MEKYEPLGVVGEGSYGIVLKCKNKADNKIVAIKKFIDSEDDVNVRKIALREIRVLKKLRHENLVNLLEVFRRRKHLYLVFEFIDHTLLEQLEQTNHGLDEETCRKYIFQILRALGFCHDNNVIHRDVKPENVLVSNNGIVKLCDFGFARNLCGPGDIYTDYVATRWYRSPELLVGDVAYGKSVDIWAAGCLFAEMSTGEPLFAGDSDIDQLFLIAQCLGRLSQRHLNIMSKNSAFRGFQYPKSRRGSTTSTNSNMGMGGARGGGRNSGTTFSSNMHNSSTSGKRRQSPFAYEPPPEPPSSVFASMFPSWTEEAVSFLTVCLDPEPTSRPTCNNLLRMPYFTHDNFPIKFLSELSTKLQLEGRTQLTTSSVRKRRSLVGNTLGGSNVSPGDAGGSRAPGNVNPTGPRNLLPQGTIGSSEEVHRQPESRSFQSNNLANQTHFLNSTNLSRQHTFVVKEKGSSYFAGKSGTEALQSRIPISLTRKSSDEALNFRGGAQGIDDSLSSSSQQGPSTTTEKRFSVSQAPKKFSFSVMPQGGNSGDDIKQELTTHPLPVTTLTFNLGPHNMRYNGSIYTTSTIPAPVRAKSPSFSSTNGFGGLGNPNLRRSSPGRTRKKVSLGGGGGGINNNAHQQSSNNRRSLPIGVSVLGSSVSVTKSNNMAAGPWNTPTTDHFLPRMTPKNGISFNPIPSGIDENNPNPFPNYGNGNAFGKKREKMEPLQNFPQSRRSSFTTDLGNIKPFLNTAHYEQRESTSPSKATLPFM